MDADERTQDRVLLTNDDGVHSPLLGPFADAIAARPWCSVVEVVVPAEEHSWIGQAITRFKPIYHSRAALTGRDVVVVSGTPADSVTVGLARMKDEPLPLVLSGINMGTNAGLGFHLNSGTVGAARQALLFGARSIAVSAVVPRDLFDAWHTGDTDTMASFRETFDRLSIAAASTIEILRDHRWWNGVDLYCIELPWTATETTSRAVAHLSRTRYLGIFEERRRGTFGYRFGGIEWEEPASMTYLPNTTADVEVLRNDQIAVIPIRYDLRPRDEELLRSLGATLSAS